MKMIPLITRLCSYISRRRRKQLGLLFIVMVTASFAEALSIGAVLPFLGVLMAPERVFTNPVVEPIIALLEIKEPSQLALPLTIFFILAAMISGVMRLTLIWVQTRLSYAIGADLSFEIYKKTLYQPYDVQVTRNSSQVISGISSKAVAVVGRVLLPLLIIVSSSIILITILVALVVIDPVVACVAFGSFGGIYALIVLGTKRRLAKDSQRISHESNRVIKTLQEGLGGIRDILIDGTQKTYCKIYKDADDQLRKSQASIQIIEASPRYLMESLGIVLIALLAYGLSSRDEGIASAIPMLGALAIGAQRMLPILQQLYSNLSWIRGDQASLRDVLALLDQPLPEYANGLKPKAIIFKHSIGLNKVRFRYPATSEWVLDGISLEIKRGSRVGFVGTTGSGKSTMLDLIMGLLQTSEGDLVIDGVRINEKNYRDWQMHIAHVPQSIFLADASIAENIAFGVMPENIDLDRVKRAASQAQIARTIETWENQYNTLVGERGIRLSGGQRQRIGIARALYKEADVIVFDEATSALDGKTEFAVMDAIRSIESEITVIMVAHRLSTLRDCDQIFKLEYGRIKFTGNYDELITKEDGTSQ